MKKGQRMTLFHSVDYAVGGSMPSRCLISIRVWGIGRRLFSSGFYHNLLSDKRNRLHTFFFYSRIGVGRRYKPFMKKIIILIMTALSLAGTVSAQTKQQIKDAKKVAKERTKDGWKVLETASLESLIIKEQTAINNGLKGIIGTANNKRSLNFGKTTARNNALNEYAELWGNSMLRARINTDLNDIADEQRENLVTGYERLVMQEIKGELNAIYTLYRINKDGGFDVEMHFLVDIDSAYENRKKALERAFEEAGLAHKYGEGVSDFINEGFSRLKEL